MVEDEAREKQRKQEKMNRMIEQELMRQFYRDRSIIKAVPGKVYDQSKWFMPDGTRTRFLPFYTPVYLGDPVSGDIPQVFDGRHLNVKPGNIQLENEQAVAEDVQILVPEGERWQVEEIVGWMNCDANAANRVNHIEVSPYMPTAGAAVLFVESTAITLTANQVGGHMMSANNDHWTNTNGAIAQVADENPLPAILEGLSIIELESTNIQAADTLELVVYYRDVVD